MTNWCHSELVSESFSR